MGDHRYGEEVGDNTTTTKPITKELIKGGLMSPRSVKNTTFDCTGRLLLENANPSFVHHHGPSRLVEPPLMAVSRTTRPTLPVLPLKASGSSSELSSSTKGKGEDTSCQRRVIFPTYPRNQQQTYSWSWMRPQSASEALTDSTGTPTTTTGSTSTSTTTIKAQIPPKARDDARNQPVHDLSPIRPFGTAPFAPSLGSVPQGVRLTDSIRSTNSARSTNSIVSERSVRNAALPDSVRLTESRLLITDTTQEDAALPQNKQLLVPPTPNPTSTRRVISISPDDEIMMNSAPILAPVNKQPQHRSTKRRSMKSLLRRSPKYGAPILEHEESLPSLVDIVKENDDDDDGSQSSMSNYNENGSGTTTPPSGSFSSSRVQTECSSTHRVGFDPRVWVREFHRTPEEANGTWFTDDDMDAFRRLALERIIRYQSTVEIIATGTGRTIQRRASVKRQPWKGPIYSHAALTLDGENANDAFMKRKVMEKELNSILIVDPHDICLKLFSKALQQALPHTNLATIVTATSTDEVLKHLEQGRRFDLIIVEERLQLFHRHHGNTLDKSLSSSWNEDDDDDDDMDNSSSWLCSPPKDSSYRKTATLPGACGAIVSSGAALIQNLSRSPLASNAIFVGVSAHMNEDEAKFKRSGADFCWPKPPPVLDQSLLEKLAKALLIKRNHTLLASELFG
eukprot:Sro546_g164100.2  (679) ;mRNA; f:42918-45089